MTSYEKGFVSACGNYGFTVKEAEAMLEKRAQLKLIGKGLSDIAKGLGGAISGAGKAISGTYEAGKGIVSPFIRRSNGFLSKPFVNDANEAVAKFFSKGGFGSKIPVLKHFGRGFAKSQRQYAREFAKALAKDPSLRHSNWKSLLGTGRGGLIGNTLSGAGALAAAHPLLGAAALSIPAVALAQLHNARNEDYGSLDTMDPLERKYYNRDFRAAGYAGLDSHDIQNFLPF